MTILKVFTRAIMVGLAVGGAMSVANAQSYTRPAGTDIRALEVPADVTLGQILAQDRAGRALANGHAAPGFVALAPRGY